MPTYRFHLEKYRHGSKIDCPSCGKKRCFVRYIDEQGTMRFSSSVGKCDHEQSCGYHYTPREYFRDYPEAMPNNNSRIGKWLSQSVIHTRPAMVEPSYISPTIVEASLLHYDKNPLYRYLCGVFGTEETVRLFNHYRVGTSAKWGGALRSSGKRTRREKFARVKLCCTIPQLVGVSRNRRPVSAGYTRNSACRTSNYGNVCSDNICFLYTSTGRSFSWRARSQPLSLHYMPDVLWLATGGKNGCFNVQTVEALRERNVILLPDLGATDAWQEKLPMLQSICRSVAVSTLLEDMATDEQRSQGLDIADFLLATPTRRQILQQMIARNHCIQQLIDELDLELIEN